MTMLKKPLSCLLIFIYSVQLHAQSLLQQVDSTACRMWVDSVMASLTPDQRLGQLIMPQVVGGNTPEVRSQILRLERDYHIGGVFFSKGTIGSQEALTRYAQKLASDSAGYSGGVPLLVGIDGEWGLAMRLSDAPKFPRNASLSRIHPLMRDTICYEYGREVARECRLLGIHINFAPVLDVNSNPKNPVIGTRSFGSTVDQVIAPALAYARGLEAGGVMSTGKHFPGHGDTDTDSHLALPRLKHSRELMFERELKPFEAFVQAGLGGMMSAHLDVPSLAEASGMPSSASQRILQDILRKQFQFKGLLFTDGLAMKGAASYPDICCKALLAGNDILLQPHPIDRQWKELLESRRKGTLTQEFIDEKCRRVLAWKYCLIIANPVPSPDNGQPLAQQINSSQALRLRDQIQRLCADSSMIIPEFDPTQQTDSILTPQGGQEHALPDSPTTSDSRFHELEAIINEGLSMGAFPGCQVLVAHRGKIVFNRCYGHLGTEGREPVLASTRYDLASVTKAAATVPAVMIAIDHYGMKLTDRLSQYIPALKGTDKEALTVQQALFHETGMRSAYNFYTLTIDSATIDNRLYSGRRVAPFTVQQDKETWFHAGLKFKPYWISDKHSDEFPLTVADGMFTRSEMRDSIVQILARLPLRNSGRYRYSDLNFVMLRLAVEKASGMSIDQLLYHHLPELYNRQLCYQPLQRGISAAEIAPSEQDDALRRQMLRGYVHDELAAWSGGVEGNAGLFGSATSLYPVLQMLLDEGKLNGRQCIDSLTCHTFITRTSKVSRRGLGFDKPETDPKKINPCYEGCNNSVFGHTGYTGSCFWIDPQQQSVFVFICNRVMPHRWNTKLQSEKLRPRMQEAVYNALK